MAGSLLSTEKRPGGKLCCTAERFRNARPRSPSRFLGVTLLANTLASLSNGWRCYNKSGDLWNLRRADMQDKSKSATQAREREK
jgi:hypothetical protein